MAEIRFASKEHEKLPCGRVKAEKNERGGM